MHDPSYIKSAKKVSGDRFANSEQIRMFAKLRGRSRAYCPRCERLVQLMSDTRAEELFRSDLPELLSMSSRGLLHRLHNSKGIPMFCGDSLFQCFSDRPTQLLSDASAPFKLDPAHRAHG